MIRTGSTIALAWLLTVFMAVAMVACIACVPPNASAAYKKGDIRLKEGYTYNSCADQTQEVDPINVVWYGPLATIKRVANVLRYRGWDHSDLDGVTGRLGGAGRQAIYYTNGDCKYEKYQRATKGAASNRFHVRLFATTDQYGNAVTVGDAHSDTIVFGGGCKKVVGLAGHIGDFNPGREKLKESWIKYNYKFEKFWGNTQAIQQCNGAMRSSDGYVLYLDTNPIAHDASDDVHIGPGYDNETTPIISGTPQPGFSLTVQPGAWDGGASSFVYEWCRVEVAEDQCIAYPGATGSSWDPAQGNVGSTVGVLVRPSNADPIEAVLSELVEINPSLPAIVSNPEVTEVNTTSAKLSSWVNPQGSPTNYYFEYGTTTSYGNTMPAPPGWSLGSGSSSVYAWNVISGLTQGTTYHFRAVATNGGGTTYGADQAFKTLSDVDGDGVIDENDWCLTRPGVATNHGCPPERQQTSAGYYFPDLDSVNMFYAQANGTLALKYNDYGPGGGWKVAQLPGGPVVGPISAIRRSNGDVLAFYRSTDSKINITWLNHLTSKWETTGAMTGLAAGPPSAVERNNGDMHAVYRGTDGAIHDLWFNNGAPAWKDQWLGGAPLGDPSVTARSDNGEVHIFYRHVNGHINVLWLSGNTWQDAWLGGSAAGDPKALYRPDADLSTSAFYKGTDGKLHDVWHDASGWHDVALGGTPAGNATPIYSTKTGDIHVFYRSTAGYLRDMWINSQNNAWTDAQVAGAGLMTGTPSPVNRTQNGDLHVFYVRSNGSLYDGVFDGTSWVDTSLQSGAAIDSDSDEVFNPEDWCPTRSGVATNHGCPPEAQQTSAGYYFAPSDSVNTFFAKANGALALKYNDYGPGGGWKVAQLPGASVVGPISSIARSNGDILAFYRSTDSKINITWLNHLTSKWETTGAMTGLAAGPPSAVERNNGDMHAVYRGTDGAIHDLWFNNGAPKWIDQALNATGVAIGEPSVTTRSDNGEVHVFYRNFQGAISDLWLSGNNWQDAWLGGSAAGDPKALYRPDADLSTSAFYKGTDGKLHDVWHDASGWHDVALGGTPAGNATPIYSTKTGDIHVFYRSTIGYLRDMWINSQTSVWTDAQVGGSGLMKGTPSPVNRTKNGDLHVFYVRSNGTLYDGVFDGTSWVDTSLESGAAVPTD